MSIIYLDNRVTEITSKYAETIGVLYLLDFAAKSIENTALNGAKDTIERCLDLLNGGSELMDILLEEPKELDISIILSSYRRMVEARSLLEHCVTGIYLTDSEASKHKSYLTQALFAADSLLYDLLNKYEDILKNPPTKQAA